MCAAHAAAISIGVKPTFKTAGRTIEDHSGIARLGGGVPDPFDPPERAAVARLTAALRAGDDPRSAAWDLLGRGPGLTPLGGNPLWQLALLEMWLQGRGV